MLILSVGTIWPFLTDCNNYNININILLIFKQKEWPGIISQHTLPLYNTKLKGHVCHRTPNFLVVGVCSMLKGVNSLLPGVYCRSIADYIPGLHVPLKNNIHFNTKTLWTGDSFGKDTNSWRNTSQGQWGKGSATSGKGSELESFHATEITCS